MHGKYFMKQENSFLFSIKCVSLCLTAHKWQKWKSTPLTSLPQIDREEAVALKSYNYIILKKWKFCKNIWNLIQFLENLIFCL